MILSPQAREKIVAAAKQYPQVKSAILPALHVANEEHGYVSDQMYREIADLLDLKCVDVAAAASFYTYFPKAPRGRYYIQVCRNISCALLGARHLSTYLQEKLGLKELGETTPDNLFTVVEVECLGSCTTAPMMQINDDYYENLTKEKVDQIIADLKSRAPGR
ncbi:MAG: NADH-quinone oxidoreductase subunit NuoE [candidate division Zixibacteria bacterium]|nr:NADH-quinone oxidoreductase subunit NuoE [candidate division Zixibacteria bacterium]